MEILSSKANGSEYLEKIDTDIPIILSNIIKKKYFQSEISFYNYLEELIQNYSSYYLFPNQLVSFYPKITEQIATKNYTCFLSGAPIINGEAYYRYRPILKNLSTKKTYTINGSIIVSNGYLDYLPKNLLEFEIWCQNLEQNVYIENEIDFYQFATIAGDDALNLRELKENSLKKRQRMIKKKIDNLKKLKKDLLNVQAKGIDLDKIQIESKKIDSKIKKLQNIL